MVTLTQLKSELPEYAYDTLTGASDSVGDRALEKARIWIKSKISGCSDAVYDENDAGTIEIVLKRALYELYLFGDQEGIAKEKKADAYELLKAKYGACIDPTNQVSSGSNLGTSGKIPSGAFVKRERNTEAF